MGVDVQRLLFGHKELLLETVQVSASGSRTNTLGLFPFILSVALLNFFDFQLFLNSHCPQADISLLQSFLQQNLLLSPSLSHFLNFLPLLCLPVEPLHQQNRMDNFILVISC
jgi:hypothetical protein